MVSLSDNIRRSNSSGGYFFDDSQINADLEDLLSDDVSDNLYGLQPFRPIKVAPYIVLLIVVTVCMGLLTVIIPLDAIINHMGIVRPLMPLIAAHCLTWCITATVQYVLHKKHKLSRTCGYLELYRRTASWRRAPLIILSAGSVCLLITVSLVDTLCYGNPSYFNCHTNWPTRLIYYVQALLLLEVTIVLINLSVYLHKTLLFNKNKPHIDVNQHGYPFLRSSNHIDDIGVSSAPANDIADFSISHHHFTQRDEADSDELLEKQADLIRYLKIHNMYLSKKIFQLTNEASQIPVAAISLPPAVETTSAVPTT